MANVIDTFCEMQRKRLDDFMLAEQVQRLEMSSKSTERNGGMSAELFKFTF